MISPNYINREKTPEPDIRSYFRVILKYKWMILSFTLLLVVMTYFFSKDSPPSYEARATLRLGAEQGLEEAAFSYPFWGLTPRERNINTSIAMLKSRSLLEEVVDELRLIEKENNQSKEEGYFQERRFPLGKLIDKILRKSQSFLRETMNRLGLMEKKEGSSPKEQILKALEKDIRIESIPETNLIKIVYQSSSPEIAEGVLTTSIESFRQRSLSLKKEALSNRLQFLESKLALVEDNLNRSQDALIQFKKEKGIYSLDAEASRTLSNVSDTESSLQMALIEEDLTKEKLSLVKRRLKEIDREKISSEIIAADPQVKELRSQIGQKEQQLKEIKKVSSSASPGIVQLEYEISQLQKELKTRVSKLISSEVTAIKRDTLEQISEYETELNLIQARQNIYRELLGKYQQEIDQLPTHEIELFKLQRVVDTQDKIYTYLLERQQEMDLIQASATAGIQVVDSPFLLKLPTRQKRLANMGFALVIGLFLSTGSAFFLEYLNRSVKTPQDVEEKIGLSLLGEIPLISSDKKKRKKHRKENLIIHQEPTSMAVESYRTLGTNIQYLGPAKELKVLLVTSTIPREGKTLTAVNLALTFSQLGHKVLLVDCDLRKPMLGKLLDMDTGPGLTDVLTEKIDWRESAKSTEHDNLYCIPSGPLPPNPSKLLTSPQMSHLLSEIKQEYDYILLDTPPVLPFADAIILSQQADAAILVIRYQKVEIEVVQKAKEKFESTKASLLGAVLNEIEMSKRYAGYYDYYRYYQGYYRKKKK